MALFFQDALLPNGWERDVRVEVSKGRIQSIACGAVPARDDDHHALGLPGISNVHSHGFQRGFAGLTEQRGPGSDSFWTWRDVMYRFVASLEPDDVEAITAQTYVEMLESGFVHVGEFHYLHHACDGTDYDNPAEMATRVVAAASETGISLTLLPVLYAHAGFGGLEPSAGQRRFVNDLDRYATLFDATRAAVTALDNATLGVAPHSLRAVTPEELTSVIQLHHRGPIHIHVAEQVKEVEDCLAWSRARPVEWLLENAPVDRRWCLIHATHMTSGESARLAASGAVVGLCPVTEANLGDGTFDAVHYVGADGSYGIGSDSNVTISVRDELRQLEYSQRLLYRNRNSMATQEFRSTGRSLYQAALSGGVRALGQGVSGFCEGSPANFISLASGHTALIGRERDEVLDSWIFAAGHGAVDCVWVGGRKVVENGLHHRHREIGDRFRSVLKRLLTL